MCSELSSTQEVSSRVSCKYCFELNLSLFNETSDLNFAHRSKVLSIRSSQCDISDLQCKLSQLFPQTLRHHMCDCSCVEQLSSHDLLLNYHLTNIMF